MPVLDDGVYPPGISVAVTAPAIIGCAGGRGGLLGLSRGASVDSDAAYDFSVLLARLREEPASVSRKRFLVTGLGDAARLRRFGRKKPGLRAVPGAGRYASSSRCRDDGSDHVTGVE